MSLINEALKKAQRQRADTAAASQPAPVAPISGEPAPRIAKRRPPMPARALMLLIGGGCAVAVMAGVVTFILLHLDEPLPPVAKIAPATPHVKAPPVEPAPVTPPTVVLPVLPPDSAPVAVVLAKPTPPMPPPVVVKPVPVVVAPPAAEVKPAVPVANPKAEAFLETLHVTGVRMSETDPKVIMNDRIFRLHDVVDRATGLRLIQVEPSSLSFTDASGYVYTKSF
ncbi:MAG: hypothetical protein JF609_05420 [Verrucomicrobia bacterium]|nr:hypothetical protein [Verrucomicrobiota bacterium]MBW8864356.1 hypothetical protein [Verrucomicrobiota bacterium]